MYAAKHDRSGYTVYTADRDQHAEKRLALTSSMRHAIDDKQFLLHYQPIVHLASGAVVAVEALLRWDHPQQGRLQPQEFIHVAEHSGLITPLTSFAIGRALKEWPKAAPRVTIAVNLSPRSLHDPVFPQRVGEMLSEYRAEPSSLALEITENVIMSDPLRSTKCLRELHDMGIQLIMDDFGTGYSSLSYLRKLPIHQLKIDKSFVMGLAAGEDDALVRSIIDLAHNLRLKVIAEGVETAAVRDRLLALRCDAAQGHFISEPAPAKELQRWLRRAGGELAQLTRQEHV
jgi:EAL domain-containing protein (putative c-di-GMP-specific phosphodiesterase class I)